MKLWITLLLTLRLLNLPVFAAETPDVRNEWLNTAVDGTVEHNLVNRAIGQFRNGENCYIKNDTLMCPVRAFGVMAGFTVDWDGGTQTVTLHHTEEMTADLNLTVDLTVGSPELQLHQYQKSHSAPTNVYSIGSEHHNSVHLAQPPELVNGTVYAPLRRLAEEMDYTVDWNGSTQTAKITDCKNITFRASLEESDGLLFPLIEIEWPYKRLYAYRRMRLYSGFSCAGCYLYNSDGKVIDPINQESGTSKSAMSAGGLIVTGQAVLSPGINKIGASAVFGYYGQHGAENLPDDDYNLLIYENTLPKTVRLAFSIKNGKLILK